MSGPPLDAREETGRDRGKDRFSVQDRSRRRMPGSRDPTRKLVVGDPFESHAVARPQERRWARQRIEQPNGGTSDQTPAAGSLRRIDGGIWPADRDAPLGDARARSVAARGRELRGKPGEVSEARREAEERNAILRALVPTREFFRIDSAIPGERRQVGAVLSAVGDGDPEDPRLGRDGRRLIRGAA